MAKVKIILEKSETKKEAEEMLFKALNMQRNGDAHEEDFDDPAMQDLVHKITKMHDGMILNMIDEIINEIEKEYNLNDNF